jgi:hypothetical protein
MESPARFTRCIYWAHSLMENEMDWVRSMQRWELILGESDGSAMLAAYKEREELFRTPEAQLARVVIACGLLGDRESMLAAAALKPDSTWVKGALGWLGEYPDARRCLDAMHAVLPLVADTERETFTVSPGMFDEEASEYDFSSTEYREREVQLHYDVGGITVFYAYPLPWRTFGLLERMGVRASELPTADDRAKALAAAAEHLKDGKLHTGWRAMYAAAEPSKPDNGNPVPGTLGQLSRGPLLRAYALQDAMAEFPRSRRWAALACFHGQPDWQVAQRWLVREALASGDPAFARLACRAVLAVRDDFLDGLVSIAHELKAAGMLDAESKALRLVLEKSKDKRLSRIGAFMAGKGDLPTVADRVPMGLDVPERAALVAAFAAPQEIAAYGDEVALLWMNRGHFLAGRQNYHGAFEAYTRAITAQQSVTKRKYGLATTTEAWRSLRAMAPRRQLERLLDAHAAAWPEVVAAIRRDIALREAEPPADATETELAMKRLEDITGTAGQRLDDDELRTLVEKNTSYTGGYGLTLLGFRTRTDYDYAERNQQWQAGQTAAPADFRTWQVALHHEDGFQRYRFMNWFAAEHHAQCYALLRPYKINSFTRLASIHARAGAPAREITSLVHQAGDHALVPYYGGVENRYLLRMQFARMYTWQYLNRVLATYGPEMHRAWHTDHNVLALSLRYGHYFERNLRFVTCGGRRGEYLMTCADFELRHRGAYDDVNMLLNTSLELASIAPEMAITLVERAEKVGVSQYGRFVGAQSYIRAKAQLGDWDAALARYRSLRDKDVGYPPYLDDCLLFGVTKGNLHQHTDSMLKEFNKHQTDLEGAYVRYALRQALMAEGRHRAVANLTMPDVQPLPVESYNFNWYSPAFHEARYLLESGEPAELAKRALAYWTEGIEDGVGVMTDAFLLAALAHKLMPDNPVKIVDDEGRLRAVHGGVPAYYLPNDRCLDTITLQILAGQREPDALPARGAAHEWHGLEFSERPVGSRGHGFLTTGQGIARDHFIRGVIAFLVDDAATARTKLQACLDCQEKFSHEYHVAEWLLKTQVPKADD